MRKTPLLALALLLGLVSVRAHASIGKDYALTSRAAALGGASAAFARDGASAFNNPAALSHAERAGSRLSVFWSILFMTPSFKSIDSVRVENDFVSDRNRDDNVDTSYPNTLGQSLGLSYQISDRLPAWSFGFVAFLPVGELAKTDSGEPFIPEYFMHRARTQEPEFDLALSAAPTEHLSLGLGLRLGAALSSSTTLYLQSDPNKTSSMRVAASLKTKAAPYLGAHYEPSSRQSYGLVIRAPLAQPSRFVVHTSARAIGTVSALDFSFPAASTMYYDPWSLEFGTSLQVASATRLTLQADYELWSRFKSPSLVIGDPTTEECAGCGGGVQFSPSRYPSAPYRDIVVPRVGAEWTLSDQTTLRAGYSYRPSILKNPPQDSGNLLDPALHRFAAGVGLQFPHFLNFNTPCSLDFHAALEWLVGETIQKSPGDETGDPAGQKIGAPGYQTGGTVWGGGVTLNVSI